MNLTLSIDDHLVERARALAAVRGTSVQQMIRDYLASVVEPDDPAATIRQLHALRAQAPGDSGGQRFNREDTYEERLRWPRS